MLNRLPLFSRAAPIIAVLAIHLFVVAWVVPLSGDAILGDDWDFSASVLDWNRTGYLALSDYPSMTLVGHLAWGKWFTAMLGSNQLALRISTVVMAWIGAVALYWSARRQSVGAGTSASFVALFLFNPVVFFYTYFFVTDVAGCVLSVIFIVFAVPQLSVLVDSDRRASVWRMISIGLFTGYCYLTRETALIPALVCVAWFLPSVIRKTFRWQPAIIAIVAASVPVLVFWIWITHWHGQPIEYGKSFLEFSQIANSKLVLVKLLRIALTIGFFISPVSLAWLVHWFMKAGSESKRHGTVCIAIGVCLALGVLFAPRMQKVRLYWGTHSIDSNVGSYLAVAGLRESLLPQELLIGPLRTNCFDVLVMPIAAISLCVLITVIWTARRTVVDLGANWWRGKTPNPFEIAALSALGHAVLLMLIWILFERYLAPLFTLLLILMIGQWQKSICRDGRGEQSGGSCRSILVPVVLWFGITAIGTYSVIWTHDTRARHEAVWDAATRLVEQGVDPAEIGLGLFHQGAFVYRPALEKLTTARGRWLKEVPVSDRRAAWDRAVPIQYRIRVMRSDIAGPGTLEVINPKTWIQGPVWELYRVVDSSDVGR